MKLLVLGGTKNLGRPVVEAALADGHQVTLCCFLAALERRRSRGRVQCGERVDDDVGLG
jgi:nucleoside-diphosphate-sugar epimerase